MSRQTQKSHYEGSTRHTPGVIYKGKRQRHRTDTKAPSVGRVQTIQTRIRRKHESATGRGSLSKPSRRKSGRQAHGRALAMEIELLGRRRVKGRRGRHRTALALPVLKIRRMQLDNAVLRQSRRHLERPGSPGGGLGREQVACSRRFRHVHKQGLPPTMPAGRSSPPRPARAQPASRRK